MKLGHRKDLKLETLGRNRTIGISVHFEYYCLWLHELQVVIK
jgi:hypothetical protein